MAKLTKEQRIFGLTLLGQFACHQAADSGAGSGDHYNFAPEIGIQWSPVFGIT